MVQWVRIGLGGSPRTLIWSSLLITSGDAAYRKQSFQDPPLDGERPLCDLFGLAVNVLSFEVDG